MGISIMTSRGETNVPSGGGIASAEMLAMLAALEERTGRIEDVLGGKLDADKVTVNTAITQGGYAADARQLNPTIEGTLAHSVVGMLNNVGNIRIDTYVTDAGGKNIIRLPVLISEVYNEKILVMNGDAHVYDGHVIGVITYGHGEYVEVVLSKPVHAVRINYIYMHS